ncbi:fibronectin-binding protein [Mycolicibacterium hodleri]|uniref:fibronectin-binding protein n=1 Tax=Mycolicibacterium hodleri TaxID=49897 RepID=UPI001F41829C|nr:fibronectin-binding protein [Mycolicibacterium hodleri]
MTRRIGILATAILLAVAPVAMAAPAAADPDNDPCQFAFSLFCRLVPIAPDLDHNIDLTQDQPPVDPAAPLPESLLRPDPCAAGCV